MECAKNKGKHLPCNWEDESVKLEGFDNSVKNFFVRVKAEDRELTEEIFGEVEKVNEGFFDEFAFVTKEMTEADFASKKALIGPCINVIRLQK